MKTLILKPNKESINLACELLKKGEIVALPTETVYGLAGDSTNSDAIQKIFLAKGRPSDNPLICHISNMEMLKKVVSFIPDDCLKLAKVFWPGPLTMIMPKSDSVCSQSCAGLDSVGVRMPDNKTTLEIIEKSGIFFSAPSANTSGKPSPTNASDVFEDMNGKIPLIIDDGDCRAGVESTVLSLIDSTPTILRPGVITKEDIEKVLNKKVEIASGVKKEITKDEKVLSPGMKYKHYAPNCEVIIIKSSFKEFKNYVESDNRNGVFALCFNGEEKHLSKPSLCYGDEQNSKEQAHNIFSKLRILDKMGAKIVYARCPSSAGVGLAVYNRLIRSAGFRIIEL